METIAVYWEPVIRTYGFNLLEKQVLCQVDLPMDCLSVWHRSLENLNDNEIGFRLVWSHAQQSGDLKFFMLCDDMQWHRLRPFWETLAKACFDKMTITNTEAEAVFFQGPHFGDRYGIMDYTYKALTAVQVPLLAATCSAASIYLVVPTGWGRKTQNVLGKAFEIPSQVSRRVDQSSGADQ